MGSVTVHNCPHDHHQIWAKSRAKSKDQKCNLFFTGLTSAKHFLSFMKTCSLDCSPTPVSHSQTLTKTDLDIPIQMRKFQLSHTLIFYRHTKNGITQSCTMNPISPGQSEVHFLLLGMTFCNTACRQNLSRNTSFQKHNQFTDGAQHLPCAQKNPCAFL